MAEHHAIVGPTRGEPRAAGDVGACIRVQLDGAPSPRWAGALQAHLARNLTAHPAVGHLRLDHLVEGSEIVLPGVERREAELLGPALRDAIAAANRVCERAGDEHPPPPNMAPADAEQVARVVAATVQTH